MRDEAMRLLHSEVHRGVIRERRITPELITLELFGEQDPNKVFAKESLVGVGVLASPRAEDPIPKCCRQRLRSTQGLAAVGAFAKGLHQEDRVLDFLAFAVKIRHSETESKLDYQKQPQFVPGQIPPSWSGL